ncbi:hypothetical protein ACSBR1_013040 [Camellia fascicularis]
MTILISKTGPVIGLYGSNNTFNSLPKKQGTIFPTRCPTFNPTAQLKLETASAEREREEEESRSPKDSRIPFQSYSYFVMDSEEVEYAAFEEKVRRNVYIDNLSPQVTEAVLRTALNQFGNVEKVQFIPNYTEPRNIPRCALVEMENSKQAKQIVSEMGNFPFMMSGMPRPVRACAAEMEMFDDHPRKPGRKIKFHWLDPQDPDFKVAKELKLLTRKHAAESSFALKVQLAQEEKLANKQAETLKANYEKYELIEGVLNDGSANRLARHYNMKSLKKPPLTRERKEEEEEEEEESRSPKDSRIPFQCYSYFVTDSEEAEYAAFEEKVRRNVYIDNLSPQVTEAVLRTALNQFGNVEKVQFIPNYTEPRNIPRCALVEMENSKQGKQIVSEMGNFPFMMSGMPRPVRARAAEMEMFDDHPRKPGRKIKFHWLDPQDPHFKVAKELKLLTRKHAAESSFALKEEKLANKQAETLKANYEKYELIEGVLNDGSANRLARHYNMKSF